MRPRETSDRDTVLLLSAVLPVILVAEQPLRALVGVVLTAIAIVSPRVRRSARYWWGLSLVYGLWWLIQWRSLDNHMALMVVWFVTLATDIENPPGDRLRRDAGLIIGLVFAFAVGWKIRSPDFLSGKFFIYTLLTDPRFTPLVASLTSIDSQTLASNRQVIAAGVGPVQIIGVGAVRGLATLLTWGTVLVESAVALLWLMPYRTYLESARNMALALFAIVTYLIAPVAGFGVMLFAIAAAATRRTKLRRAYVLGAALLFVFSAVWNAVVL